MNQATQVTQTETVPVDNLDQFVTILADWHANRVAQVRHMMQMPEGTEVQVDDGTMKVLTGELREGFLIGLHVALAQLGTLPFAAEVEDNAAAPEVPGNDAVN